MNSLSMSGDDGVACLVYLEPSPFYLILLFLSIGLAGSLGSIAPCHEEGANATRWQLATESKFSGLKDQGLRDVGRHAGGYPPKEESRSTTAEPCDNEILRSLRLFRKPDTG